MLYFIVYILPVFILLTGLIVYFIGRIKENNKVRGIGIGIVICLVILELPEMTKGFIEGYVQGIDSR